MYVLTASLPGLNWLLRIDVSSDENGSYARYARVDENGNGDSYTCPIGPDTYGIGLPTVAVLDMIRDLHWLDIDGDIVVVHAGVIDKDGLREILRQARPAYEIANLACTATAH